MSCWSGDPVRIEFLLPEAWRWGPQQCGRKMVSVVMWVLSLDATHVISLWKPLLWAPTDQEQCRKDEGAKASGVMGVNLRVPESLNNPRAFPALTMKPKVLLNSQRPYVITSWLHVQLHSSFHWQYWSYFEAIPMRIFFLSLWVLVSSWDAFPWLPLLFSLGCDFWGILFREVLAPSTCPLSSWLSPSYLFYCQFPCKEKALSNWVV